MLVLVVNAGSSSLKLRVLDDGDQLLASRDIDAPSGRANPADLQAFLEGAPEVRGAGHRVVHGGREFRESVLVSDDVLVRLRPLADLAPLHNPPALAGLEMVRGLLPGIPNVACFDTAFHATIPDEAAEYALPTLWRESWGIRRFGFHGLNHAYASRRAAELLGRPVEELRLVTCHLGAGASLAAVEAGRSVDTTMGFTPMEGLVMATRSGSVDPGAVLWVQRHAGLSPDEVERILEHQSGVLGLSGLSADMRAVLQAAAQGDPRATLAVDVYVHRLCAGVAAMAASLGGLDGLVFTAGVGEGSALIRDRACRRLGFLGVELDHDRNESAGQEDANLSPHDAAVPVLLVHAREDLEIAREVRRVVGATP
ncbi:MAG TPA: acetate/propionate family kinase [Actinomycetota bacterium]